MVDYSRFDRIADDLSDDEDSSQRRKPQVTRLSGTSAVTFGGGQPLRISPSNSAPLNARTNATLANAAPSAANVVSHSSNSSAEASKKTVPVRGGINYAKWDAMAADISDDEESEGNDDDFDGDDFGPPGDRVKAHGTHQHGNTDAQVMDLQVIEGQRASDHADVDRGETKAAKSSDGPSGSASKTGLLSKAGDGGIDSLTKNGALVKDSHAWSQEEREVRAAFFVPAGTRAKAVKISVSEQHIKLVVGETKMIDKELAYPVSASGDDEDGLGFIDWEVTDAPLVDGGEAVAGQGRIVLVTLVKKDVAFGKVVVWWKRFFKDDEEIDLSTVSGRRSAKERADATDAWKEAHRMFREKVKNRTPTMI